MAELTDREKQEKRRQRRQQKIMAGAGDRLNRITGTAFPHRTASPTPSPSTSSGPSTSLPRGPTHDHPRLDDDPSDELGAPPPLDPLNMFGGDPMAMFGGGNMDDMFRQGGMPPGLLSAMTGAAGTMPAGMPGTTPPGPASPLDPTVKYWNLLHLTSMVLLGFYAVWMEWSNAGLDRLASLLNHSSDYTVQGGHVPLFWYFATMELGLQSARFFYQKGQIATVSTLGALATQLPPPLNQIVTIFLRYRLIWTCLVQDISVLLFIIGCAEVVSALLA
ncbi:hypothetical protein DM01DRAFT_1386061 [Hesseltinella vesiculosa]|uniref:GET complex, subunit GET2 n=1 Tax=Hesseltinella vesiculosa TaxID=101127 RepID=A0A1X2G7I8_9FUNG|nr:hypothetical protein DM01DRAFT_1386061 [Hesseltinella vesiculosa]